MRGSVCASVCGSVCMAAYVWQRMYGSVCMAVYVWQCVRGSKYKPQVAASTGEKAEVKAIDTFAEAIKVITLRKRRERRKGDGREQEKVRK